MSSRETFFRSRELKRESRMLPAETYNLAKILRFHSGEANLFVPIRSLLYLAVVDDDEIVFLDGTVSHNNVLLAWQRFRPQERKGLSEPLPYETVYYADEVLGIMPRLQGEFHKALQQIEETSRTGESAEIIPLHGH
jgi:hypothetical protein